MFTQSPSVFEAYFIWFTWTIFLFPFFQKKPHLLQSMIDKEYFSVKPVYCLSQENINYSLNRTPE